MANEPERILSNPRQLLLAFRLGDGGTQDFAPLPSNLITRDILHSVVLGRILPVALQLAVFPFLHYSLLS